MKTKFIVRAIGAQYGEVELTLIKYVPPEPPSPPPLPEEPIPDPLETFVPETDEEKVMLKMFKALRKMGMLPEPPPPGLPPTLRFTAPSIESKLTLTKEEYIELGKPGIGQLIELVMEKSED